MNAQKLISLTKKSACVFAFVAGTVMMSGCVTPSASAAIPIGTSKEGVISIVGRGNVNLAKKRTQTTANGVKEVWILYKGPLGWGWAENGLDSQVIIEFENGLVTAITE